MSPAPSNLQALFRIPVPGPSLLAPHRLPGVTHESSLALLKTLQDNHVKWHAFFNDQGFHNHASHHLVAIYAMGASGPLIEAAYQTHVVYMKPAVKPPGDITDSNFWEHLGEKAYYDSYLRYFRLRLLERGASAVLEEYVFSAKANVGDATTGGPPRMLHRFLASILHPFIHTGCGLEFGILGLVAEGLAQTCVHPVEGEGFIPLSIFQEAKPNPMVDAVASSLNFMTLNGPQAEDRPTASTSTHGAHAFTILAKILKENKFSPAALGLPLPPGVAAFNRVEERLSDEFISLTNEWAVELASEDVSVAAIEKKIEEIAWLQSLLYGVGGWAGREASATKEKQFSANFFTMHLVTSSIFLPSFVPYLSLRSAALLLRAYFTTSLALYVAQGRPPLPIREFYANTTSMPAPPGEPHVQSAPRTLTPKDVAPNPWLPIIQTTLVHPNEHLCKLQRALLHNATLYATRGPGHFAGTGLEGAEVLDSTLFVRAAGLTADRLGWMKEGQETSGWDFRSFA